MSRRIYRGRRSFPRRVVRKRTSAVVSEGSVNFIRRILPRLHTWRITGPPIEPRWNQAWPAKPSGSTIEWAVPHCCSAETIRPASPACATVQVCRRNRIARHASMIGLHGVYVPSRVKVPSLTAITAKHQNRNRTARPMLLPFPAPAQKQHRSDSQQRRDKHHPSFQTRRKVSENSVDPENAKSGFGAVWMIRRVRLPVGPKVEEQSAGITDSIIGACEDRVLPRSIRTKGIPVCFVSS